MTNEQNQRTEASPQKANVAERISSMGWTSYLALCAVGVVIVLTSIGPSASEGLGTLNTMAFWAVHVVPALVLLAITQMLLGRIERVSALPGIVQVILSAMVASLLFAPMALAIDALLAGEAAIDNEYEALWLRLISEIGHFFVPLILIWCLINAPSLLQLERGEAPEDLTVDTGTDEETSNELAEFWSRVPGRLGRRIVAMSAELHYVRVYTTEGDTLILFPFGRAVDLLQDQIGMQIHRSHWIALRQVDEVVSKDGRVNCEMISGLSLPVSRSYRAALKAAQRGI